MRSFYASADAAKGVIELTTTLLSALGAGAGSWRIVRSKGGRGWFVDTASGWISGRDGASMWRDLERRHPWRRALEILAEANGNVSSGDWVACEENGGKVGVTAARMGRWPLHSMIWSVNLKNH
jgi:hypothetical protein